jgi:hypothetical protein
MMQVTVTLSHQQQQVLADLAGRFEPALSLEQLVARAFTEYCDDHPELWGEEPDAGR